MTSREQATNERTTSNEQSMNDQPAKRNVQSKHFFKLCKIDECILQQLLFPLVNHDVLFHYTIE
jgi:hypothetical protein